MADKKKPTKPTKPTTPPKPVKKLFNVANFEDMSEEEQDKILDDIIDKMDSASDVEPKLPTKSDKAKQPK